MELKTLNQEIDRIFDDAKDLGWSASKEGKQVVDEFKKKVFDFDEMDLIVERMGDIIDERSNEKLWNELETRGLSGAELDGTIDYLAYSLAEQDGDKTIEIKAGDDPSVFVVKFEKAENGNYFFTGIVD